MTVSECCLIKLLPYISYIPYILCEKIYPYFSTGNGRPGEPALCQLYRHTFVPYRPQLGRAYMARGDSSRYRAAPASHAIISANFTVTGAINGLISFPSSRSSVLCGPTYHITGRRTANRLQSGGSA